ncbi:MAG: hypothetical protein U0Y68_26585 [Blastocatellia bacterium]
MDMQLENILNLSREVNGLLVVMLQRGHRLGQVVDKIVHPTEGVVLELVLHNAVGQEQLLTARDCFIYRESRDT